MAGKPKKTPAPKPPQDNFNSGLEVGDVEDYVSGEEQTFSHQALVMEAMRNAIQSQSHEMKEGFFNKKVDQQGNLTMTYVEDTRLKFIQSVEALIVAMSADLDDESKEFIQQELNSLDVEKDKLLQQQIKAVESLKPIPSKQFSQEHGGESFRYGLLKDQPWYGHYMSFELEAYKNILIELNQMLKRLDFYAGTEATT